MTITCTAEPWQKGNGWGVDADVRIPPNAPEADGSEC